MEDNYYSPSSLAWKLLLDDLPDEALSSNLVGFTNDIERDVIVYTFELLLSIFMEMVFHLVILMSDDATIDLSNFDMNDYLPTIDSKFKRMSYFVGIETFERNNIDEYEKDYIREFVFAPRYCRVILRHSHEDKHYFDSIGSEDNYDFILSDGYTQKYRLKDVYAVILLNDKIYKIHFDRINRIENNFVV